MSKRSMWAIMLTLVGIVLAGTYEVEITPRSKGDAETAHISSVKSL
jgi:hypothetical protein